LLPLHNVLEVAEQLRIAFEKFMTRDHDGYTFADMTASTGIAIVHHTHNLQQAVEEANNAQKIAKEGHDRNALAVAFLRRSGESRSMGAKWHAVHDPTAELLQRLIGHFLNDGLAYNLPYDLEQIIYSMVGKKVSIDQVTDDTYDLEQVIYRTVGKKVPHKAIKAELGRVVKRRLPEKGKALAPTIKDLLVDLVICSSEAKKPWDNMLYWVELARFLAQTQPTSEPTRQEELA
jgi:CRISPR/Cas system-associated protein Cas10 (large subunit of type III CRISPR-Cas system)